MVHKNKSAGLVRALFLGLCWLINHISDVHFEPNASDFFAVSRHVVRCCPRTITGESALSARLSRT